MYSYFPIHYTSDPIQNQGFRLKLDTSVINAFTPLFTLQGKQPKIISLVIWDQKISNNDTNSGYLLPQSGASRETWC